MKQNINIGIIGGGISGVSLAYKLGKLKEKDPNINIKLLEANHRLGGTINTIHKQGFAIESGTNGFLDNKPFTLELFKEAGLAHKLVRSNDFARIRFIERGGKLNKLPSSPMGFLKSDILSLKGKLRIFGELFVPQYKGQDDETLANFIRRRLGEEMLDYLIGPMVSGVFAGDPEKMSVASCFPVIHELEAKYGGLIKGMFKKPKKQKSGTAAGPTGVLTSYEGGMIYAVKDLAQKAEELGVEIKLDSPCKSVSKKDGKFFVEADESYFFDYLAICTPAYASCDFLKPLNNASLTDNLANIPYSPMFVVGMGFEKEDIESDLLGFGYLIPRKEGRDILGALFTSSIFPMQAPTNTKLLRIMIGGDLNHEIVERPEAELIEIAKRDVSAMVGIKEDPYLIQTFKFLKAIPQYHVGHAKRTEAIEKAAEEIGNLFIAGNVLHGIGLNDCVKASKLVAERIEASLNA